MPAAEHASLGEEHVGQLPQVVGLRMQWMEAHQHLSDEV
jgi:hypothetical protein